MSSATPCFNAWNGTFRAVLNVAIRTGIADLRGIAAADEAADLTIERVGRLVRARGRALYPSADDLGLQGD